MAHEILIVEDDAAAARLLVEAFEAAGYRARFTTAAEPTMAEVRARPPDLLILDLGLPRMSGAELCRLLKKDARTASLPIIMLTSRKRDRDKVAGLEVGADDYVTKPYSTKELLARVAALLRRVHRQGRPPAELTAGAIRLDLETREVTVAGRSVPLRPKELELLALFLRNKGRVLTHELIADALWGTERRATSQDVKWWVHHLRKRLGEHGGCIESIVRLGYKLIVVEETRRT